MLPSVPSTVEAVADVATSLDRHTDPVLTPYYHLVPKDFFANLRFRRALIELAAHDTTMQSGLWKMCARDPLFWCNAFVYTYDPRNIPPMPSTVPFITYAPQDKALLTIFRNLGINDMGFDKSRCQGGSWIAAPVVFLHEWIFFQLQSFLIVSRVQDLVDAPRDLDALMPKIDFVLERLPGWMVPHYTRTKLHLYNDDNGSSIDGASTTGNVGRGGRRRCILLDEFAAFETEDGYKALAATQAVTYCRLFLSTPQGIGNAFYDTMQLPDLVKIRLHWSENPSQNKGLYTSKDGTLLVLDNQYQHPANYRFVLDGKVRSPWYDKECGRTPIAALIAQELDIEYLGSGSQFFDAETLRRLEMLYVRPPRLVGELDYDGFTFESRSFLPLDRGRLRMWCTLDAGSIPSNDSSYVVAADVATGTGASNSAISVVDLRTGEKVAEFVSPHIIPDELAKYALALCRWFKGPDGAGAFLIWEANGPGREFGSRIIAEGYHNIYYKRNEDSVAARVSDVPGYSTTKDSKRVLLSDYARALSVGRMINRSAEALRECAEFVFGLNGVVEHVKSSSCLDPSGARDNHADRVIADALAAKVLFLFEGTQAAPEQEDEELSLATAAGRFEDYKRQRKRSNEW